MKVSVILPALNEAEVIERTLTNSVTCLNKFPFDYEVMVVDNFSSDNTVQIVENFSKQAPKVRVIRHPKNLGYANSNLTGFKNATGDIVVVADSDGQHTLADLPIFLEQIDKGHDVVYGWRKVRHDPILRKVISVGLNWSSGILLDWPFHDINCGFRAVTSRVAKSMEKVHPVNYFGPELWVHAQKNGFKVAEVVVQHAEREGGVSIHAPWRLPRNIMKAYQYLFALRAELREEPSRVRAVSAGS